MGDLIVWGNKDDFFRNNKFKGANKYKLSELSLDDLKVHFTCGYCYHLAIWLNRLTDLPIYNVADNHAVVGNGKMFLDITGWQTKQNLKGTWHASDNSWIWRTDDLEEFDDWGRWSGLGEELSPRKMKYIATKVLDTYGHTPPLTIPSRRGSLPTGLGG